MTFAQTTRRALALTSLLALGACGDDTITSPIFGGGCTVGSIAPGQTRTGAFTEESCHVLYNWWSGNRTPYESYTVSLTAGHAYMFYLAQIPDPDNGGLNEVDAVLSLWGKNDDGVGVPLAASDDEADGIDGLDSQIWFIAPVSGTFQLIVASYDDDYYGGYRLEAHECPVLATFDTAGTYTLPVSTTSPCQRVSPNSTDTDTSRYAMIRIPAEAGEQITIVVDSAGFTPMWEMFGPGFDTYANIYEASAETGTGGVGNDANLALADLAGDVTLAIGGSEVTASGNFKITLTRTPAPAPPPGAAPWSIGRLQLATTKPRSTKAH